ncbi:MAG: transglutaminase-like domain-containing protein, partial [Pirellulaceae bacterium]
AKYSTKRAKADQSPYESMESGLASCTGLSVLLVDACRSVGIPARVVGTPLWTNKSGNHSWVEIWDNGWHFTGACEATGDSLDRGWFVGRAATAKRDELLHAIYAVSYKRTPQFFPMVWAADNRSVHAVNVTDRYTRKKEPLPEGVVIVMFRAVAGSTGDRQVTTIKLTDQAGQVVFSGKTKDERFDANDHVEVRLRLGQQYQVTFGNGPAGTTQPLNVSKGDQLVTLSLP